jgi:hypothetical protein
LLLDQAFSTPISPISIKHRLRGNAQQLRSLYLRGKSPTKRPSRGGGLCEDGQCAVLKHIRAHALKSKERISDKNLMTKLLLLVVLSIFSANSRAQHSPQIRTPEAKSQEQTGTSWDSFEKLSSDTLVLALKGCDDGLTKADYENIQKMRFELSIADGEAEKSLIADRYLPTVSKNGQKVLATLFQLSTLDAILSSLTAYPQLRLAYANFERSADHHKTTIENTSKASMVSLIRGSAQEKIQNSGNDLSNGVNRLVAEIRKTNLDKTIQASFISSVQHANLAMISLERQTAKGIVDKYSKRIAIAKAARDTTIGTGLVVAGLITAGTTSAVGVATIAATGSKIAAVLAAGTVMSASGAALGGGAGLVGGDGDHAGSLYRFWGMLLNVHAEASGMDKRKGIDNFALTKLSFQQKITATLAEHIKPYITAFSLFNENADYADRDMTGKARTNRAAVRVGVELSKNLWGYNP